MDHLWFGLAAAGLVTVPFQRIRRRCRIRMTNPSSRYSRYTRLFHAQGQSCSQLDFDVTRYVRSWYAIRDSALPSFCNHVLDLVFLHIDFIADLLGDMPYMSLSLVSEVVQKKSRRVA